MAQEAADDYPSRPVKFVVATMHLSGPGTLNDIAWGRIASQAEKFLGQPILVDNTRMGRALGAKYVADSRPDGYTIGSMAFGSAIYQPHFVRVPYRIVEDFTWMAHVWDYNLFFIVRPESPWRTFRDFIEDARSRPLRYVSPVGPEHAFLSQIARTEKAMLIRIDPPPQTTSKNYRVETVAALLGGFIDAAYLSGAMPVDLIKAGKVRALAFTGSGWPSRGARRLPIFPDIPTFTELGHPPHWWGTGVVGPRGIPSAICEKIESAFAKALGESSVQDFLEGNGVVPHFARGEEWERLVQTDYEHVGQLIRELIPYLDDPQKEGF